MSLKLKAIQVYIDTLKDDEYIILIKHFFNQLKKSDKLQTIKQLLLKLEMPKLHEVEAESLILNLELGLKIDDNLSDTLKQYNFVRLSSIHWRKKNSAQYVFFATDTAKLFEVEVYFGNKIDRYGFTKFENLIKFIKSDCFKGCLIFRDVKNCYYNL